MSSHEDNALRHASLCRQLHLLASGEITSFRLVDAYLQAIERDNPRLRAFYCVDAEGARAAARASDARRQAGSALGRLDGVAIAIKDNLDVAGLPTTAGLAARRTHRAVADAFAVARLRAAGAVILGKTALDEAALGAMGSNAAFGNVPNPVQPTHAAGGSSSGSAVAVAAGLCSAALGSDTLGSLRIPAAFCDIFALRPTLGEVSCSGLWPALPRLDAIGPLTRSLDDLPVLLQVLAGHDPSDPRSRRRRVPLALPDWEPARLRSGIASNLVALGADGSVVTAFHSALERLQPLLGERREIALTDLGLTRLRRAALMMMEAGLSTADPADLAELSADRRQMLAYAAGKSAIDYARADRQLDAAVVSMRRMFDGIDVLLLPTVPVPPPLLGSTEPANLADFTALASIAGCPALSLPLGQGIGLQLVGPPGSDLRLLELGQVTVALIEAVDG
jgi:aspartyl-tRNA(Asn)/glutamyl-tRNA(Gln) amidotransferase subunit A